ncbi:MAG: hypothetical protein LBS69_05085 [Prevotellaceae bacterium]|jgi:hypothetical protein|nr:hypothetical protein [Prevotellaceae bacterium]
MWLILFAILAISMATGIVMLMKKSKKELDWINSMNNKHEKTKNDMIDIMNKIRKEATKNKEELTKLTDEFHNAKTKKEQEKAMQKIKELLSDFNKDSKLYHLIDELD